MDPEEPPQPSEDEKTEKEKTTATPEEEGTVTSETVFFEQARQAWKRLGTEVGWTLVFGDLYVKRFPIETGSTSATAVKKSIFEADDSVHEWDASGVRKTIRERMIKAEARGLVREWYADLAFFCERMNFLKGIKEDEIDFIARTSLMADAGAPNSDVRNDLLKKLDPPTKIITESMREEIRRWALPQLEVYGFLAAMTTELFPYSKEELEGIVSLMLDPDKVDMFLRARFIDPILTDEPRPLIGFEHPDISTEENFVVKYFSNSDKAYYQFRIAQLWFYALLKEFSEADEFLKEEKSNLLATLASHDTDTLRGFLRDSILLSRWFSIATRFLHSIRSDYAFGMDYGGYASDLSHLLQTQDDLTARFTSESAFPIPFDKSQLEKDALLLNVGVTCIESVMKRLEDQIPVPEGAGAKRAIMAKRRANLRNAVLPEDIRTEIMDMIFEIKDTNGSPKEIEEKIRYPGDILFPRGEAYFKDMKEIVRQQMEAMGDLDLRKELKLSADTPQVLVKQYGNTAITWLKNQFPGSEPVSDDLQVYAAILSLKTTELMFSSATTSEEERNTIAKQLFESVFQLQVQSLGKLSQEPSQPTEEA
ncbi:MAG: hypothetical protein ACXADX_11550 [Candidatus Hodarchaeales archaeon]|jgi:hypothetical protein